MRYRGQVQNGVVVFNGATPLKEGTVVEVQPVRKRKNRPRRGSAEAILGSKAHWHGDPEEMDRLLADLREMKWAEVRQQQARGE